jgi:hypothetical protein
VKTPKGRVLDDRALNFALELAKAAAFLLLDG